MTDREENLWARRQHGRHAELYDAEYAKQLDRIARIRNEVSASLPEPPPDEPASFEPAAPPPAPPSRPRSSPPALAPLPSSSPLPSSPPPPSAPLAPLDERALREPSALRWDARPANFPPKAAVPPPRPARRRADRAGDPWRGEPTPGRGDASVPRRDPAARHASGTPRLADPAAHRDPNPTPRADPPAPTEPGRASLPRSRWLAAAAALVLLAGTAVATLSGGGETESPAATVFRVPGQPTGLVVSRGQVWVAGPMSGAVWILDGVSGQPAAPALRPGGTPARVALDGRFAWIADTERGAVVRAPRSGAGKRQLVRAGPDVADLVIAGDAVWTASSADGTVRVLDAKGRRRVLHVGGRPIALSADAGHVVAVGAAGTLIRLTARTRRADGPPVVLGGAPVDVALVGDRAWVADAGAGTVRSVTLSSGIAADAVSVCRSPVAIAADAAGVYVLCRGDRSLVRLDADGAVRSRVRLDHAPTALALDSRHVWIAAGSNEVIRVDR